jgi:hypothetical protein
MNEGESAFQRPKLLNDILKMAIVDLSAPCKSRPVRRYCISPRCGSGSYRKLLSVTVPGVADSRIEWFSQTSILKIESADMALRISLAMIKTIPDSQSDHLSPIPR